MLKVLIPAVAAGTLVLVGNASAAPDPEKAVENNAGMKLTATLSGSAEVPGPGDVDGTGQFSARVVPGTGQFCYLLDVDDVDDVAAAHIHVGDRETAGPVAITLVTPTDDDSENCTTIEKPLAKAIATNPDGYYVNVHNAEFPAGAVRGQLTK